MERIVTLHIEKLPEGVYLATSDDVQGLVAPANDPGDRRDCSRRGKEADRDAGCRFR
jgi:hypothetical protein